MFYNCPVRKLASQSPPFYEKTPPHECTHGHRHTHMGRLTLTWADSHSRAQTHSHGHRLTLKGTDTHTRAQTHTHKGRLTLTGTDTLTRAQTHTHMGRLTLTGTDTLTRAQTHTHGHRHTHMGTDSHSQGQTHTHGHRHTQERGLTRAHTGDAQAQTHLVLQPAPLLPAGAPLGLGLRGGALSQGLGSGQACALLQSRGLAGGCRLCPWQARPRPTVGCGEDGSLKVSPGPPGGQRLPGLFFRSGKRGPGAWSGEEMGAGPGLRGCG